MFTAFLKVTYYIAKVNSHTLYPLLRRNQNFTIGYFAFRFWLEQEDTPDCTFYDISNGDITASFTIISFDTSIECGPESCLNFAKFIWKNLAIFRFKLYDIVAAPFDTPKYRIKKLIELLATVVNWISSATTDSMNSKRNSRRSSLILAMLVVQM